jgi:hypothetical protein
MRLLALLGLLCALYAAPAHADEPDPAADLTDALYAEAVRFLGSPYRWGGEALNGVDCSGFTRQVWGRAAGVWLPHYTDAQAAASVPTDGPRFGDLVLFRFHDPKQRGTAYPHVGLVWEWREGTWWMIDSSIGGVRVRPFWPGVPYEIRRPRQSPA